MRQFLKNRPVAAGFPTIIAGGTIALVLADIGDARVLAPIAAVASAAATAAWLSAVGATAESSALPGIEALDREIDRSRRYEHEFSLVQLNPADAPPIGAPLRSTDVVFAIGDSRFIILVETGLEGALGFLQRAAASETHRLGLAVFPHDAVTADALVALASSRTGRHVSHHRATNGDSTRHDDTVDLRESPLVEERRRT